MKFIGFDAGGSTSPNPSLAEMSAIYEVGGQRVYIPASTHEDDIELAVIDALGLSDNPAEARALLAREDDSDIVAALLDEILPFLEQRGFNRSARLNALIARRETLRQKYPDGQPVPKPRRNR